MNLAARNLAIGYGRRIIGEQINIAIGTGHITCLLGPNGCGKTTLFKTMLGLIRPLGGEIRLDGEPLSRLSRAEIARLIAYVPQVHSAFFPFSVLDVVLMGRTAHLRPYASPGEKDRQLSRKALEMLGIDHLQHRDYSRLSGGQRQLVLIARALVQDTPLIVLDEPTASLDFGNQALVLNEIQKLANSSDDAPTKGIILSTHNPDQVFHLAADVMAMKDGQILATGKAHAVLTEEILSTVYGIPMRLEKTGSGRLVCSAMTEKNNAEH